MTIDKAQILMYSLLVFFGIMATVGTLTINITKDTQFLPTFINGITSCTSIMIAACGFLITYAHSNKLPIKNRIHWTIVLMGISSACLFFSYSVLIIGGYEFGLRLSMLGLLYSMLNLFNIAYTIVSF